MLGSASHFENIPGPQTGKWIWKDDTNTLEFFRIASSMGNRSFGASRANVRVLARSPRPTGKGSAHATFTLDDIKNTTLEMFAEVNPISDSFYVLFHTEQFNDFLLHLLNYFYHYFVKSDMDAKPKDMYIEPGISEIKAYADVCTRVAIAQKLLGQSYSVLVMGLGLDDMHHMACGHSRVSYTRKDRSMYETFYSYICLFVWINFKRKDCPTVRKEIGRILRSDTFNPAIRVKNAPDTCNRALLFGLEEKKEEQKDEKLTPAEYRRLHGKRPAIQSIINQRSPAVVSIVPSPKEESLDLFQKKSSQNKNQGRPNSEYEDKIEYELKHKLKNLKVGILGDFVSNYNPQNLMALSEEKDDTDLDNATQLDTLNETGHVVDTSATKGTSPPDKLNRQLTAISQATTEAFVDDD